MNKKINIDQLQLGMFVISIEEGWSGSPMPNSNFRIRSVDEIAKLRRAGVGHVCIDSQKGIDVSNTTGTGAFLDVVKQKSKSIADEVEQKENKNSNYIPTSVCKKTSASPRALGGKEEAIKARFVLKDATNIIKEMMLGIRAGDEVDLEKLTPIVDRILQSVERNSHALTGICRLKGEKNHVYEHCVSVASLLVVFAKFLELDEKMVHELAIGGLIHDFGKTMIPDAVVNKKANLTKGEYTVMMNHVAHNNNMFENVEGLSGEARDVALMHHERMDGNGYPLGLKGEEISLAGQMAAIIDVYDTLSSNRILGSGTDSGGALLILTKWCPAYFDRSLVDKFIQCLGLYPVGSLVELSSGKVGLVTDQGEDILKPQIRIIFDMTRKCYVKIEDIDMKKAHDYNIVGAVSASEYKINIGEFW